MKTFLIERARYTKFGWYSSERDKVYVCSGLVAMCIYSNNTTLRTDTPRYKHGVGNLSAAAMWAKRQLSVYDSPETHFDLGTFNVMLSEMDLFPPSTPQDPALASAQALFHFERSHNVRRPWAACVCLKIFILVILCAKVGCVRACHSVWPYLPSVSPLLRYR